ncbi:MAG: hypothetical protein EPO32_03210 [Anaerolineae bacterium]|nr:MAG: hypothetical protein EPO32_03210 [Anaerolineae bacterium]
MQILGVVLACVALYIIFMVRLGGFTLNDLFTAVFGIAFFQFKSVNPNVLALVVDVFIFGLGGLVFWVAFFSQFVLPVRTVKERQQVAERVLSTLGSGQGPAILIENGRIVDRFEGEQRGPGVILLDTASAAVLHNQTSFTRAVGPGLVFTQRGESIFSPVDLHTQIRRIGPLEKDLDPDSDEGRKAKADDREAWIERRKQTSALTRDMIEVIPNITAIFRLRARPGEGSTRFGYNQDSVWRAVAHQGIDPGAPADGDARLVPWDWLPVQLAADLWREYVRKFEFAQLFDYPSQPLQASEDDTAPMLNRTVFETIVYQINARMKQDLTEILDDRGMPYFPVRRGESRERRLMLERGLDIISISISNLRFAKDPAENSLIERWTTTWHWRALEAKRRIDELHAIERSQGMIRAQDEFASRVSRPLFRRLVPRAEAAIPEPSLAESLELLVQGTLDDIGAHPEWLPQLTDVTTDLNEIKEWLRANRGTGPVAEGNGHE